MVLWSPAYCRTCRWKWRSLLENRRRMWMPRKRILRHVGLTTTAKSPLRFNRSFRKGKKYVFYDYEGWHKPCPSRVLCIKLSKCIDCRGYHLSKVSASLPKMLIQDHPLNGTRIPCLVSTRKWLLHLVNPQLWMRIMNHNDIKFKSWLTRHHHIENCLHLSDHNKGHLSHLDTLHQFSSLP